MGSQRFVLLDRDGVINLDAPDRGYVRDPKQVQLLPRAAEAIAELNAHGYEVLVCSNQQCVGKGIVSPETLDAISVTIQEQLAAAHGGRIRDFFYCTHLVSDACACRKPRPGLLYQARDRYGFDLAGVYFVGDSYTDLDTARNAGCRAILVLTGNDGPRYEDGDPPESKPYHVARDLFDAAQFIVRDSRSKQV